MLRTINLVSKVIFLSVNTQNQKKIKTLLMTLYCGKNAFYGAFKSRI